MRKPSLRGVLCSRILTCLAVLILSTILASAASLNTPAPRFTLTNSHRQTRTLSDYKGKVVFVNFWASWCGPCQLELPELNRLAVAYKGKKVQILAINAGEQRSEAEKLLAKLGLSQPALEILWDSKSKVVSAYNADSMPSSFIIDKHGLIRFIYSGFHPPDPSLWRQEINTLLTD